MSEVGFRDTSAIKTPSSKPDYKKESPKPALKMVPPTSLVPVKGSLPPRPSKPGQYLKNLLKLVKYLYFEYNIT